jgi:hypothetical protein
MPSSQEAKPRSKTEGKAAETADPREQFWKAGEGFYNALVKAQQAACEAFEAASREQQEALLKVQSQARQRADEIHYEYLSTLQEAKDSDDFPSVGAKANRKYQEALAEVQAAVWKETAALYEARQKALQDLQTTSQRNRLAAYVDYAKECQRIWGQLDAGNLSCESLAFIGQSLTIGAQLVGGRA